MPMRMFKNAFAFSGALLVTVGGWAEAFPTYKEAFQFDNLGSLMIVVGALIGVWNMKRPKDAQRG